MQDLPNKETHTTEETPITTGKRKTALLFLLGLVVFIAVGAIIFCAADRQYQEEKREETVESRQPWNSRWERV